MNSTDEKWLLEEFPKYKGLVPRGEVWGKYLEAERILLGKEKIMERGCGCVRNSVAHNVDTLYEQWLTSKNTEQKGT